MTSQHLRATPPGLWLVTLGYLLTLVALSLHPFEGWRPPEGAPWDFLFQPLPRYRTQFDLWTNLLAYLPLGLLLTLCLRRLGGRRGPLMALALCMLLSFSLESLQSYLPTRRAQWLDLLANSVGAALGCLAWAASQGGRMMREQRGWESVWSSRRSRWVDSLGLWGLWGLLGLWLLAQAAPMPLWLRLGGGYSDIFAQWALPITGALFGDTRLPLSGAQQILLEACVIGLNLTGLCLLLSLALEGGRTASTRPGRPDGSFRPWGRLVLVVLLMSLVIRLVWASLLHPEAQQNGLTTAAFEGLVTQLLGPGVQAGLFLALLLSAAGLAWPARVRGLLSLLTLATALFLAKASPIDGADPSLTQQWSAGRWQNLRGATQLAALAWPWLAMAWTILWLSRRPTSRPAGWAHKMRG